MPVKTERVAVLGASKKPDRYSNKAVLLLKEHGHNVVPVHPVEKQIEGLNVAPSLREIGGSVDTLTVYVGPHHIAPLIDEIVALRPGRVILNPGTESSQLESALTENGIPYLEACTLVLLKTGQF
ncbi:MAG TPA: CoA-binding protein [Spirochaetia bacterium]|nr:CoA-binding protein [Spirochaetia bacterium]